jgi:hypothetical protein
MKFVDDLQMIDDERWCTSKKSKSKTAGMEDASRNFSDIGVRKKTLPDLLKSMQHVGLDDRKLITIRENFHRLQHGGYLDNDNFSGIFRGLRVDAHIQASLLEY